MSIQLISNLLQALAQLLVVGVTQLYCTQLGPGHGIATSMSLDPLVDETTQGGTQR